MLSGSKGDCLISHSTATVDPTKLLEDKLDELFLSDDTDDDFENEFEHLSLSTEDVPTIVNKQKQIAPPKNRIDGLYTTTEFMMLQNERSLALARTIINGDEIPGKEMVFDDLINVRTQSPQLKKKELDIPCDFEEKENKKTKTKTLIFKDYLEVVKIKDDEEGESNKVENRRSEKKESKSRDSSDERGVISRGPIRNACTITTPHPYGSEGGQVHYGTTAQTPITDISMYSGFGNGYECGSSWTLSPSTIGSISASTTPDTVLSDITNSSALFQDSPKAGQRAVARSFRKNEIIIGGEDQELPESLQDFILQYSNQYGKEPQKHRRPKSADSGVESPMSARSAPNGSPLNPKGSQFSGPNTPSLGQTRCSPVITPEAPSAKQKLHASINETDLAFGFHWAITCATRFGTMSHDSDGDTPLHIVIAHMDLAKIYALCETLRKTKSESKDPFNLTNQFNESPLYMAVMQRSDIVVEYLLELGASPNAQSSRFDNDSALHHAASRGLSELTGLLVTATGIDVNAVNAHGNTALLCAVKNHGLLDETTQTYIDNKKTIEQLLRAGANPSISEASTGKSIIHVAIERMDVDMLDVLKKYINEDTFTELANHSDFFGETAVDILSATGEKSKIKDESNVRQDLYIRLLASGAIGNKTFA